ncbi:MAG: hypothetical protein JXR73_03310 [Candidatus Omnitrophica bacterium]|nr:hypothetical protein [Candidatus Omnitrophota bacterium]
MLKRLINIFLAIASVLVCLTALELFTRIGAMLYESTWAEKQQRFVESITVPFSYGVMRPNASIEDLRDYFPSGALQPDPIPIQTNNFGMRMRNIHLEKSPDAIRIAVMGDSCTFGWMLPEEDSYARTMERILNGAGQDQFEALNFGIPGYTSFHGLQLYERLAKPLNPDLLVLAFGFNDSYEFRFSEKEFYEKLKQRNLTEGLSGLPLFLYDHSAFCHWLIRRIKSLSKHAIEQELIQRAAHKQWHARVDQDSYRANLQKMIEDMRSKGGDAIVLNLDLPNTWVREPLQRLHEELDVAYLDVQSLFHAQSRPDPRTESLRQALRKEGIDSLADRPKTTLLFRVWIPEEITIQTISFLLLNSSVHPFPWQIRLFDDGSHGDEQAGDRVWSGRIEWESNEIVDYCFLTERLPDEQPLYENSLKALRYYHYADLRDIPPGAEWISPIHTLNRLPFEHLMIPGDVIHPNAQGHQVIAENLAPIVREILSK